MWRTDIFPIYQVTPHGYFGDVWFGDYPSLKWEAAPPAHAAKRKLSPSPKASQTLTWTPEIWGATSPGRSLWNSSSWNSTMPLGESLPEQGLRYRHLSSLFACVRLRRCLLFFWLCWCVGVCCVCACCFACSSSSGLDQQQLISYVCQSFLSGMGNQLVAMLSVFTFGMMFQVDNAWARCNARVL